MSDSDSQSISNESELKALLGSLHTTLAQRLETVARVAERLQELHGELETHFGGEEKLDGFFQDVIHHSPHLAERTNQLKQEHGQIHDDLRQLVDFAADPDRADWWQRFEEKIDRFRQLLVEHQQKEARLFQDALGTGEE